MSIKKGKGLYQQIDFNAYKWPIFDENGDRKAVSYAEYVADLQDRSEERQRRHRLGLAKSIRRGVALLDEVVTEMIQDANVAAINQQKPLENG